jgi:hypothetical protein
VALAIVVGGEYQFVAAVQALVDLMVYGGEAAT